MTDAVASWSVVRASAVATGFALVLTSVPAHAERLFAPAGRRAAGAANVARVDDAVARGLGTDRRRAAITGVPLADGSEAAFEVAPVEVFTADATIVAFDGVREQPLGRPDVAVYEGTDPANAARTLVLAISGGTRVFAIVRDGQQATTVIHPLADAPGEHAVIDPAAAGMPEHPLCDDPVLSPGMSPSGRTATMAAITPRSPPPPGPTLVTEVLVDVGYDLYSGPLGSNATTAADYVAGLFGAVSVIYRRDVNVAVLVNQLVVWTSADPFGGVNTATQLSAYDAWNEANRAAVPRDVAHLLANLPNGGGRAYLDALCDNTRGYGVNNVNVDGGSTTFATTGYFYDVNLIAHELGHNFGSPHTHCYMPPLDECYNAEPGCYAGPVTPSVGETMSYCHLVESVEMGFGTTVAAVVRSGAETGVCIATDTAVCGDGTVDPTEQCDDGNILDGDCCSSYCVGEPTSQACADDADPCTTDVCDGTGACGHMPPGSCSACDYAIPLPAAGGTFAGSSVGSGSTAGTCGGAGGELVFEWTPAASGVAIMVTCYSNYDTVVYVREADCTVGPELNCDGGFCGDQGAIAFFVEAGTTYYLFLDSEGAGGSYVFELTPPDVCGDGLDGPTEECDDGNADPEDGCTNDCTACSNGVVTAPEECDDGNLMSGDGCSASCTLTCPMIPLPGCRLPVEPEKATILLKDNADPAKDQLKWSWGKGATTPKADFGSPFASTGGYVFCLYDGNGHVLTTAAPPGGTCGTKPCWADKPTGYAYKDKLLSPRGLAKLDLKEGLVPGKAKIGLQGKGGLLGMPGLAGLTPPLRAQLSWFGGPCWEAVFSTPFAKHDATQLKDKSD